MLPVCPKCDLALMALTFRDVEVDYCSQCRGYWLDAGEVERLMEVAGTTLSEEARAFLDGPATGRPGHKYLCPRCDREMEQIQGDGSQLTLDRCAHGHGLWFDHNEFLDMLRDYGGGQAAAAIEFLRDMFQGDLREDAAESTH